MNLDYGKEFTILRVVGVFISLLFIFKAYGIYSDYHPGSMHAVSFVEVIIFLVSAMIVLYCFTMYWRVELRVGKVISSYGFLLLNRQKVFEGIDEIQFKLAFIEVKNGPDKPYLNVLLNVANRDRPYPVCALYSLKKSILMPAYFKKKHEAEIVKFHEDIEQLLSLFPDVPRAIEEKAVDFYNAVMLREFPYRSVSVES